MDVDEATVEFEYNRQENTTRHHTDEYENDVLVLRRGATFHLGLTFQNVSSNDIKKSVIRFNIGRLAIEYNIDETGQIVVE